MARDQVFVWAAPHIQITSTLGFDVVRRNVYL